MKGMDLTLRDLTINEANSLLFVLDSLRSGKGVEVRVFEQGHTDECADGSCSVPQTSEPVAIDTPYKPNDEVVEATYEVAEKPKKGKKGKGKGKRAAKVTEATEESPTVVSTADAAPLTNVAPAAPAPAPVVAVPTVTKVDVDAALDAVFKKGGMSLAKSVLSEFAVVRSRDLPVEKYPEFIARANEIAS